MFNLRGGRKYVNKAERRAFFTVARKLRSKSERTFCLFLYYTGCRISEGLELMPKRLDTANRCIVFRTLKRRKLTYRAVPVPSRLMRELIALAHECGPDERLFPWSRQTGWRRIKELMDTAQIIGPQASPKGLRHQYGVLAIEKKIPEGTLQRWMGHARLRNTQIYTFVTGPEERALAKRMWATR